MYCSKDDSVGELLAANRLSAFPNPVNASLIQENWGFDEKIVVFSFSKIQFFPDSGSGNNFQGSGMSAIDSSHKTTPSTAHKFVSKVGTSMNLV
jgi:hypothetical protein